LWNAETTNYICQGCFECFPNQSISIILLSMVPMYILTHLHTCLRVVSCRCSAFAELLYISWTLELITHLLQQSWICPWLKLKINTYLPTCMPICRGLRISVKGKICTAQTLWLDFCFKTQNLQFTWTL
jgi:hypothetical protein